MTPADLKILLVDDDPSIRRLLEVRLRKAGYESIRQAEDGGRALLMIADDCPDFLITDWEMPNVDGSQLCRKVRQLDLPHYVFILFLTARSSSGEVVEGLEAGADDYLSKPVNHEQLLARLRAGTRILELERRLSLLARTDALTGLMSRRAFHDHLQKEFLRAGRCHLPLSCVMLDIDFFKRVNDIHGHPAGDATLKAIADLLAESTRGSDSVYRFGGEEFCVMLPETDECAAALWADRTRQRLSSLVIPIGDKELRVTGSFGVAQKHDDTLTPENLVDEADQALLCAKQSGRDRVVRHETLDAINDVELDGAGLQKGLFHGIAARHVMTPMVACVREDETVGQAAEFFLRTRINSTPVVNADVRLTGILSEKDLLAAMVSLDCWQRPVAEVMRPSVITYEEETPIKGIYEFLCRVSIRRIVIVNGGRPTGTISRGTLLRWFRNLVISKGLLDHPDLSGPGDDSDPHRSKERLAETAAELARQATALQTQVRADQDDLVSYVVGGATGMQELVNDLLAYSRYANPTTGLAAAMQSMLLDSSAID